MIGRLNHVAIAVKDLEASTALYRETLGARVSQPQAEPGYGARPAPQMRSSAQAAPQPQQEAGQADDDLEIPSFLRRLAN